MKRTRRIITICCLLSFCTGCAWTGTAVRDDRTRRYLTTGRYEQALALYPESEAAGGDEVMVRLERGMLLQLLGRFEESAGELEAAAGRMESYEERAVISASETVTSTAGLLLSEGVRPYEGEDYEKVMVHTLDALNYLMLGNLEDARVEIRRAYARQRELARKHEKDLVEAQESVSRASWEKSLKDADPVVLAELENRAARVQSVYQNAFAYYISALVYELGGEDDEAYIDLKKALKAWPDSPVLGRDLKRLAARLGEHEDLRTWEQRFGPFVRAEGVDVVLIHSFGQGPARQSLDFPIPRPRGGFVSASLPVCRFIPTRTTGALIAGPGGEVAADTLFDADAVAARNLLDRFPVLFARQVVRTAIKAKLTDELTKEYGAMGALTGTVAAVITEKADLRAWSTLPKQYQVARTIVPAGTGELVVRPFPWGLPVSVQIPDDAAHVIMLVRTTDAGMDVQSRVFSRR